MPKVIKSAPKPNPFDTLDAKHILDEHELDELLHTLSTRFTNMQPLHPSLSWTTVQNALVHNPELQASLAVMEATGGEPTCVQWQHDKTLSWVDCSEQTPQGRRALCYDLAAWQARKANKPYGDAVTYAQRLGGRLLNQEEYLYLQSLIDLDTKTSSWLDTPSTVRELGGALFGDKRYATTFIYHNGADSYYSARGFRVRIDMTIDTH